MIIECIKCHKKFDVDSDLIPNEGRTIQCGSCKHVWFFDKKTQNQIENRPSKIIEKPSISNENKPPLHKKIKPPKKKNKILSKNEGQKNYELTKYQNKPNNTLNKLLSYLLVIIISFVAIIIVLDTFKSPLYKIIPNLELLLFNLFETLRDISLFIKDLI